MFLTVRTNPEAHVVHVSTNYLFLLIRNQSLCNTVHVPFTANINLLWPFVACKWVEFHTVDINYEFWWWRIWTKGIKPWDVLRGLLSSLVFDQIYYVLRQLFWTKTYLESVENILRCNSGTTVCVNMLLVSLLTQVIFWKKKTQYTVQTQFCCTIHICAENNGNICTICPSPVDSWDKLTQTETLFIFSDSFTRRVTPK